MKNILVTGGCGFVGRNLTKKLLASKNTNIWIIDDLSIGLAPEKWIDKNFVRRKNIKLMKTYNNRKLNNNIFFLKYDLMSILLAELGRQKKILNFKLPSFNEIYHLASIVGGRQLIDNDPLLVGIDLAIDSIFFLWAGKINKPQHILYTSSSAAYPINKQKSKLNIALKENMIDFKDNFGLPDMTYGWSKLTGEYLAKIAHEKYKLNIGIVRPFSGYGGDQDLTYPVPSIALRVANNDRPVIVWGDGNQTRDFVHINDCIDICIKVCRRINNANAFNIGSGKSTSFKKLAKLLIDLEKYKTYVKPLKKRPVGVMNRFSNNLKTKKILNWTPKISLEVGMKMVLDEAHIRLKKGIKPTY